MSEEIPAAPTRALTNGSLLGRNVVLNLGGSLLPAIAALVAVPILVHYQGEARFGVMALAWTSLGYFSLFDLGIGRAVTHAVADRLGDNRADEIGVVIWTSLATILPVGLVAGVGLYWIAPWLSRILSLPVELQAEATTSFKVLAFAVPFATLTGALRGALEGRQYFGLVNALRIPLGLLAFLGPLATLPFSRSLVPAMFVVTIGRVLLALAHYVAVARAIPGFRQAAHDLNATLARRLLKVGGWMQVSHMVSPLMATLDRFVVGAVLGATLVTYYVVPQELVTKLWLFNIAVLPVFFSAVSTTAFRDAERTVALFDKLLRVTLALLFLPALVLVALAADILLVWLGPEFAARSSLIMQLVAIAVFINCLGQAAIVLIQGLGRPDVSAKYHLLELPFYGLLLWWLLPRYGVIGAAIAWSVRTVVDTAMLMVTCPILLPQARQVTARIGGWLAATTLVLTVAALTSSSLLRFPLVVLAIPTWLYVCWNILITPAERALPLRSLIAALRPGRA